MRRISTMLAAAALLATACSGRGAAPTTSAGTVPTATTTSVPAATTTSVPAATTTSVPAATTTSVPAPPSTTPTSTTSTSTTSTTTTTQPTVYVVGLPSLYPPASLSGEPGVLGSGCTPGSDDLPDGVWFGYLVATGSDAVTFDLACYLVEPASTPYLTQDDLDAGITWYLENDNPKLRDVPVAVGAVVYQLVLSGGEDFVVVPYPDWPLPGHIYSPSCPGSDCPVWVYVNGGAVTEVVEAYFP